MSNDAEKVYEEIRAKAISLVDAEGRKLIEMKVIEGQPSIMFYGKEPGSVKVEISVDPDDGKPSIVLYDQNSSRIELYVDKNGVGQVKQSKPSTQGTS
jgi:hypothetical protein